METNFCKLSFAYIADQHFKTMERLDELLKIIYNISSLFWNFFFSDDIRKMFPDSFVKTRKKT